MNLGRALICCLLTAWVSTVLAARTAAPDAPLGLTWGMSREGAKRILLSIPGAHYDGGQATSLSDGFSGIAFNGLNPRQVLLAFTRDDQLMHIGFKFQGDKNGGENRFREIQRRLIATYGAPNMPVPNSSRGKLWLGWEVHVPSGKRMLMALQQYKVSPGFEVVLIFADLESSARAYGG